MKGKELYDLYAEVHADSVSRWDSDLGAHVRYPTAVSWHYLNSKEQKIWTECANRLGDRRVRAKTR